MTSGIETNKSKSIKIPFKISFNPDLEEFRIPRNLNNVISFIILNI